MAAVRVAQAIGRPTAVRAVARACGANPVALIVPCHRVVRADGTSGGYHWGAERKEALLSHERARRGEDAAAEEGDAPQTEAVSKPADPNVANHHPAAQPEEQIARRHLRQPQRAQEGSGP